MAELELSNEIPAGDRGRPFTSAVFDLGAHGYVEEEWFVRGEAMTYGPAPGTALGNDGRWPTTPIGSATFSTRLLVRRPVDTARFDGTVVLEWLNVSGGIDLDPVWAQTSAEIMRSGSTWVGVSAQRAGVNGPPFVPGFSQPLTLWDPARYGTLDVPDDDASYGIFTAAARLAREGALTGGSPGELLIASGASQSANRLVTYVNGVDALEHAVDGFLVHGRVGTTCPCTRSRRRLARPRRLPDRPRRAGPGTRVGVRHLAIVASAPTRQRRLPLVGACGLDAPGRVRRAHIERTIRARPRSRAAGMRLRGERHAVPLRGERGVVAPARLGAPRRAAA